MSSEGGTPPTTCGGAGGWVGRAGGEGSREVGAGGCTAGRCGWSRREVVSGGARDGKRYTLRAQRTRRRSLARAARRDARATTQSRREWPLAERGLTPSERGKSRARPELSPTLRRKCGGRFTWRECRARHELIPTLRMASRASPSRTQPPIHPNRPLESGAPARPGFRTRPRNRPRPRRT